MAVNKLRLSLEQLESRLNLSAAPLGISSLAQFVNTDALGLLRSQPAYVAHFTMNKVVSLGSQPLLGQTTLLKPTGLAVSNITTSSVSLSWTDNATSESGYYIYRSRDNVTYGLVGTIGAGATSFTDTTLASNTKYYFKVAAYSGSSQAISYAVGARTLTGVAPNAPASVAFSNVAATSLTVNWSDSSTNETGFRVYRSLDGTNFTQIGTVGANVTSYADSGLAPSTAYSYRVTAYNNDGQRGLTASITTLDASTVVAPLAPSAVTISSVSTNGLTLGWTDNATNEDGLRVYRSTDNLNFSVVANLAAGSTKFNDSGLACSTSYYYKVEAFNIAGRAASSVANATTLQVTNPVTVSTRNMTSFTELVIDGTSIADNILVTQSGSTLVITANGQVTNYAASYGDIVIRGAAGNDSITIDSSVNVAALIYGGDGSDILVNRTSAKATIVDIDSSTNTMTGNGVNTAFWANSSDVVNATSAEISLGGVNRVSNFYQPSIGAVPRNLYGQNLVDPTDGGATYRLTNNSFFGTGASMNDVNQGQLSNCYFLAPLASLANNETAKFMNTGVDLGDGTYAIRFTRNGVTSFVRVDGDLSYNSYAHAGASGNLWGAIYEKAYAFYRSGASTYASLNWGYIGAVFSDLGFNNASISAGAGDSTILTAINNALNAGKAVAAGSLGSISGGAPIIASHAYSIVNAWRNSSGVVQITLRNPWGFDGAGSDSNTGDGLVTITYAQFAANFSSVNYATV